MLLIGNEGRNKERVCFDTGKQDVKEVHTWWHLIVFCDRGNTFIFREEIRKGQSRKYENSGKGLKQRRIGKCTTRSPQEFSYQPLYPAEGEAQCVRGINVWDWGFPEGSATSNKNKMVASRTDPAGPCEIKMRGPLGKNQEFQDDYIKNRALLSMNSCVSARVTCPWRERVLSGRTDERTKVWLMGGSEGGGA